MTKEAFDIIRKAVTTHPDKEGSPIALALIDVTEELLSKLERIAVATETLAQSSVVDGYGYHSIRTSHHD